MKITLITVGKIKEKYLKDAIAEYSKRLSKYCKLDIIEVPDEKTPDQASETVEEGIRSKEGEKILRYIKDDMYVITLEIAGKMLTSEELAERIEKLGIQGKSSIAFVIGGSIGLGKEVLKRSDYALSFSKMTFQHKLMRVILLNKRRYEKRGKQDERKSSEEISDGGNVCGLGDRSSDGIPYDSECGKYFFAYAHSGIDLRSALWMAVWADMWDFSACIIQSVYRNASGCNPSGNAL